MYGSQMGSLAVSVQQAGGKVINSWNTTGNQGDRWLSASLSIPKTAGHYQVRVSFD